MMDDPRTTPWHPKNCPGRGTPDWCARCREWCRSLRSKKPRQQLRTDLRCPACGFGFVVRTDNARRQWENADILASALRDDEHPQFYDYGTCCDPDCKEEFREYSMNQRDPAVTPWHESNHPIHVADPAEWAARCRAWCEELNVKEPAQSLRNHVPCKKCGFHFIVRTTNVDPRPDADCYNFSTCCNPDCRAEETESF